MAPPAGSSEPGHSKLKRLQFVQDTALYFLGYGNTAEALYKKVKSTAVPSSLHPSLSQVENTITSYTAPLVAKAGDLGTSALHLADEQVDYVLNTADKTYNTGKSTVQKSLDSVVQIHQTNMKTFSDTSAAYYAWVQQFTDWAKDKLNPVKGGQAALDALTAAMKKAQEATDPDVAAKIATDAWATFASVPIVAKVLDTADPVTRAALGSFQKLHDNVVSWTLYKKAVDTSMSTINWAATTPPYKLGARYMYPIVQPVADPTLEKLSHSKVVKEVVDYWKPTATAA